MGFPASRYSDAQPMCIQLSAPLQVINVISQPLLYRVASAEGLITSEGTLLPGEIVDLHSIFYLFGSKVYMSIRMINYKWSKWVKLFSNVNPFEGTERTSSTTLKSMDLTGEIVCISMYIDYDISNVHEY